MVVELRAVLLIIMLEDLVVQVVAAMAILELQEELETDKLVLILQLYHKEIVVGLETALLNTQDQVVEVLVMAVAVVRATTLVMVVLVSNFPQHLETLHLNLQVERVVV